MRARPPKRRPNHAIRCAGRRRRGKVAERALLRFGTPESVVHVMCDESVID